MAIVYELTLKQLFHGQSIVNRFNFLGSGTPLSVIPSFALINALGFIPTSGAFPTGTFGLLLQQTQPDDVTFIQALARTVTDEHPTDFYDEAFPTGVTGARTGVQSQSPIAAYGFRTNRVRTDIARGTKRFVGVCEPDTDAGGELTSAAQTALNALAAKMSEVVTYSSGGESLQFAPIVCKKLQYTTPRGKRAYKYYPTQATQQLHIAQGIVWQPYDNVRGQESRQYKSS